MSSLDPELQNNIYHDFSKESMNKYPVYPLIHTIRNDVEMSIGPFFLGV